MIEDADVVVNLAGAPDRRQPALAEVGPQPAREPRPQHRDARRRHRGERAEAGVPGRQRHLGVRRPRVRAAHRERRHPRRRAADRGGPGLGGRGAARARGRRPGLHPPHGAGHGRPEPAAQEPAAPVQARARRTAGRRHAVLPDDLAARLGRRRRPISPSTTTRAARSTSAARSTPTNAEFTQALGRAVGPTHAHPGAGLRDPDRCRAGWPPSCSARSTPCPRRCSTPASSSATRTSPRCSPRASVSRRRPPPPASRSRPRRSTMRCVAGLLRGSTMLLAGTGHPRLRQPVGDPAATARRGALVRSRTASTWRCIVVTRRPRRWYAASIATSRRPVLEPAYVERSERDRVVAGPTPQPGVGPRPRAPRRPWSSVSVAEDEAVAGAPSDPRTVVGRHEHAPAPRRHRRQRARATTASESASHHCDPSGALPACTLHRPLPSPRVPDPACRAARLRRRGGGRRGRRRRRRGGVAAREVPPAATVASAGRDTTVPARSPTSHRATSRAARSSHVTASAPTSAGR